tara:strand:- start:115 stop:549 length:435 start_codon:yes stop_codon:yes gene_type:complete
MSEITVELKNPFEYSYKGDMVEAQFIVMPEPGFKELDKIAPIKQAFVAAVNDLASEASEPSAEAPEGDTESITGPQIMALMYRSKGNMSQVFLYAQELFKSVALVDGEQKLTVPIMEKMSVSDFERLLGEYLANFIAPSLMDGL